MKTGDIGSSWLIANMGWKQASASRLKVQKPGMGRAAIGSTVALYRKLHILPYEAVRMGYLESI